MNFTRFKKRGLQQRTNRVWFDESRTYRIWWRNEAFGIRLPARFFAGVECRMGDGTKVWRFAHHRRPYKTMKAAIDACEKNEKLWQAVIELGAASGRRHDRLMTLNARGRSGGGDILGNTPAWAAGKVDPMLMGMLQPKGRKPVEEDEDECDDQPNPPDPTDLSSSTDIDSSGPSDSFKKTQTSGPVSTAKAADTSMTQTTRPARSKVTKAATPSGVHDVAEADAQPAPKSKHGTTKSSPTTSRKKPGGKPLAKRSPRRSKS